MVTNVHISKIAPYQNNAKIHPQDQIEKIERSIDRFGFLQPLVIDNDGVIVVGHGRFLAGKNLGFEQFPCVIADKLSEKEIDAYRIADNKLNESAWDMEILKTELEDLEDDELVFLTGVELDAFENEDEEGREEPRDEDGYQRMKFRFTEQQSETVKSALAKADQLILPHLDVNGNDHRKSNALHVICREWLELKGY